MKRNKPSGPLFQTDAKESRRKKIITRIRASGEGNQKRPSHKVAPRPGARSARRSSSEPPPPARAGGPRGAPGRSRPSSPARGRPFGATATSLPGRRLPAPRPPIASFGRSGLDVGGGHPAAVRISARPSPGAVPPVRPRAWRGGSHRAENLKQGKACSSFLAAISRPLESACYRSQSLVKARLTG